MPKLYRPVEKKEWIALQAESETLNASAIRRKWDEHLGGQRNWQYQLWNVLMFQSWLRAPQGAGHAG
jgi:hypothetical protein